MKNENNAFTLIEIIIVILLVSILAVISYRYFIGISYESKRSRVINDLNTLSQAMIRYYADNGHWPSKTDDLIPDYISENKIDPWGHAYSIYIETSGGKSKGYVGCVSKTFNNQQLSGVFAASSEVRWQPVDSE